MLDVDTRVTTAADRESEGVGEVVEDIGEIVVVETEQEVCDPPDPPIIMAFVDENGTDGADALNKAITALKNFSYDPNDLKFTFGQMEIKMKAAGVKKQFTKLQTLTTVLPKEVIDEIKPLLRKDETEFENNDSYKQAKVRIMEIFGQSDEEPFERAMGRVLTGKPSQLARAIVNDVCDRELNGCCCHKWVGGQWKRNLPTDVKQHIADMPFTADNFNNIMKSADNAFGSTRPAKITPAIAAVVPSTPPADPSLDQAFHPAMPWPQPPLRLLPMGREGVKEEEVEVPEDALKEVKDEEEVKTEVRAPEAAEVKEFQGGQDIQDTKLKDMLTSLHLSPVFVTGPSGNRLIFVRNQLPALGRTCGCPSQTNETGTSPKLVKQKTTNLFIICCTDKNRK